MERLSSIYIYNLLFDDLIYVYYPAGVRAPAALQPHPAHRRVPGEPVHQGGDEGVYLYVHMFMLYYVTSCSMSTCTHAGSKRG
jgi:hypothetical protein